KVSEALESARKVAVRALAGIEYLHTYDRGLLMTVIVLGYVGWMALLIAHLLRAFPGRIAETLPAEGRSEGTAGLSRVRQMGVLLAMSTAMLLMHRGAPLLFFAYFGLPIAFWCEAGHAATCERHWSTLQRYLRPASRLELAQMLGFAVATLAVLETLIVGFIQREVHTGASRPPQQTSMHVPLRASERSHAYHFEG
ncbi:hypothetical protein CYMTET_29189, partial [Cymbomonas tetramitiformis]